MKSKLVKKRVRKYVKVSVPPGKPLVGKYVGLWRDFMEFPTVTLAKILSAYEKNGTNCVHYKILSGTDKGKRFLGAYEPASIKVFKTAKACRKCFKIIG